MLDQLPIMAWRTNPDFSDFYLNRQWEEFTGQKIDRESLEGQMGIIHPNDRRVFLDTLRKAIADRQHFQIEYRLKHHDGKYSRVVDTGKPSYDPDGSFTGFSGICQAIQNKFPYDQILYESEERFQKVVESVRDYAIYMLDPDGQVISWNPGAENIKGYSAEEIIGQNFSRFYTPESRAQGIPQRNLRLAVAQGRYEATDWRVRKDGTRFWANIVITALCDEDNRLLGFAKVVRDDSSRKQAEDAIQRQTEYLKLQQDITIAANQAIEVIPVVQHALERVCQSTGWSIGHGWMEQPLVNQNYPSLHLWYPQEAPELEAFKNRTTELLSIHPAQGLVGHVITTAKPHWITDLGNAPMFLRPDEALHLGLHSGVAIPILIGEEVAGVLEFYSTEERQPDAELIEVISLIGSQLGRMIERQRNVSALRDSETRFRTIFEGAPLGIELVDLEGHLLAGNPALANMLGLEEGFFEKMVTEGQSRLMNMVSFDDTSQVLLNEMRLGVRDFYSIEKPLFHSSGAERWGRLSVALVRDGQNRPRYAIGMLEDVSERVQMETELAELQHRLMEGRELERLKLAQELHDGPLQSLYGLAYHLKAYMASLPPETNLEGLIEVQQMLQRIVRHLRAVTSDLRPPSLAPFGLEKAIRAHIDLFQEAFPDLVFHLDLETDGLSLPEGLRLALFRIYQQLLGNVIRHAEAREIHVRFYLEPEQIVLEVEDDGHGFEVPVRWIDLARKGQLGLVSAIERADTIGGKLNVSSRPGLGTLVSVIVPRKIDHTTSSTSHLIRSRKIEE